MANPKPSHVQVWPQVDGIEMALTPMPRGTVNELLLDFSNFKTGNSSSLAITLLRVLKIVSNQNANWKTNPQNLIPNIELLYKLNFFQVLNQFKESSPLFPEEITQIKPQVLISHIATDLKRISYPIEVLPYKKKNYENNDELVDKIETILGPYYKKYKFNLPQTSLILSEIFKNTTDHAQSIGIFGIDIEENLWKNEIEISFSFGDLGPGINEKVKSYYKKNGTETEKNRTPKWDHTVTYFYALEEGKTTSLDKIRNKGLGMSIIARGAKSIGMELFIFDAKSMGLLHKIDKISHGSLRSHFISVGNFVGFYYYGKLKAIKR